MKAGCVIFFFQVVVPGEDARCCNIPKLKEGVNSKCFGGGGQGEGPQFVRVKITNIRFVLSFPRWLAVRPTVCAKVSIEWSDECCFCLHLYIHSKLTVHQGMMCTTRGTTIFTLKIPESATPPLYIHRVIHVRAK